jgi:hypothetical protein
MIEAWNLVGTPDPSEFPKKLQPGQPLGDLTAEAILLRYKPLILSRLKHFRVAGDKDARAAAQLGLLNALAEREEWLAEHRARVEQERIAAEQHRLERERQLAEVAQRIRLFWPNGNAIRRDLSGSGSLIASYTGATCWI